MIYAIQISSCQEQVKIIEWIENQVIEQEEVIQIPLHIIYQGQLIDFKLNSSAGKAIRVERPYSEDCITNISESSYIFVGNEPFPESSAILQLKSSMQESIMSLYMINRDMDFFQFDISEYVKAGTQESPTISLVSKINVGYKHFNALCRDLTYIRNTIRKPPSEYFLIFCRGYKAQLIPYHVIFLINKPTNSKMTYNEYEYLENDMDFIPEFKKTGSGFRYLRNIREGEKSNIKYFSCQGQDKFGPETWQVIMSIDITMIRNYVNISNQGPPVLKLVQRFIFIDNPSIQILDFIMLKEDQQLNRTYFAFSAEYLGLLICYFTTQDLGNPDIPILNYSTSQNCQILYGKGSPFLFKPESTTDAQFQTSQIEEDSHQEVMFGVRLSPPEIVEYIFSDPLNVQVLKKYALTENANDKLIGTRFVAVNRNYLLHLIFNPENMEQRVRVYDRKSSNLNSAKYEIPLALDRPVNFYGFPNDLIDTIVIRDEIDIKIISLKEYSVIINYTDPNLYPKLDSQKVNVALTPYIAGKAFPEDAMDFKVQFLPKNNIDIIPADEDDQDLMNKSIFYNCGDDTFSYLVSSFYDGPNYNLTVSSNTSAGYFEFENQYFYQSFEHNFDFSSCRMNFIFPPSAQDETSTIMICVDFEDRTLRSYDLQSNLSAGSEKDKYRFEKTNTIKFPRFASFFDLQQDLEQRTIVGIIENQYTEDQMENELFSKYEFHYFNVQDAIAWKSQQDFPLLKNISLFYYNQLTNKGLVVEYYDNITYYPPPKKINDPLFGPSQIFYVYQFNPELETIYPIFSWRQLYISQENRTVKAFLPSDQVLFTLSQDRIIRIYQRETSEVGLQLIKELHFINPQTQENDLKGFDIFENRFFVTYRGKNLIEIFEIERYIQLRYRMRLPLYSAFSSYSLLINPSDSRFPGLPPHLVRTYFNSFLALIFKDDLSSSREMVIFGLNFTQHNTFILSYNVTELFQGQTSDSPYANIVYTGMKEKGDVSTIGVMTPLKMSLYKTQYYNQLVLKGSQEVKQKLIEECKGIKRDSGPSDGSTFGYTKEIDSIIVRPETLFKEKIDTKKTGQKELKITVRTQNQGMAPASKVKKDKQDIYFTSEDDIDQSMRELQILHESYLEGQGLTFRTTCTYFNDLNCTDLAVRDESTNLIYRFSIEFATSSRKVIKQFTLGKLFFMFDTLYKLTVMRFPRYQQNLTSVDGFPLRTLNESLQQNVFGCKLNGFSDYYNLTDFSNLKNESYLFFYHCNESDTSLHDQGRWILHVAVITAFNEASEKLDKEEDTRGLEFFRIQRIKTATAHCPYQIIDLDKITVNQTIDPKNNETSSYTFHVALSCSPSDQYQYTNFLKFFELQLFVEKDEIENSYLFEKLTISAHTLQIDTFKVSKLLPVRDSSLLFAISEEFGLYIFNLTAIFLPSSPKSAYLLSVIDLWEHVEFQEQIADTVEKAFKIISFILNMPAQVICITNFGLFLFDFPVDLRLVKDSIDLKPRSRRQISLQYDEYDSLVVANPYGAAFLVRKQVPGGNGKQYTQHLIGASYFSSETSFIFKTLDLPVGKGPVEQCTEINQNSYFESTPEDQLAVSFICNQFLYVYRMCMRPHVVLDFSQLMQYRGQYQNKELSSLEYNKFKLELEGRNQKSKEGDLNVQKVEINIHFAQNPKDGILTLINVLAIIALSLTLYLLSFLENALSLMRKLQLEQQENQSANTQITDRSMSLQKIYKKEPQSQYRETEPISNSDADPSSSSLDQPLNNNPFYLARTSGREKRSPKFLTSRGRFRESVLPVDDLQADQTNDFLNQILQTRTLFTGIQNTSVVSASMVTDD